MSKHRWSLRWPGNFCLDCLMPDPLEETENSLIPCDCASDGDEDCTKCYGTGAMINPDLVIPPCPLDTYRGL